MTDRFERDLYSQALPDACPGDGSGKSVTVSGRPYVLVEDHSLAIDLLVREARAAARARSEEAARAMGLDGFRSGIARWDRITVRMDVPSTVFYATSWLDGILIAPLASRVVSTGGVTRVELVRAGRA